ncbi:MAG: response regulator, partial [Myxococcales bacterium]|nr:response regulator [Myxococcales bacterium]
MSVGSGDSTTKVFLVDDDEVDRLVVERLLHGVDGVALSVFGSGEDALTEIASAGCDCLLLDYRMPELDGLEVLDRIRAADLNVPTIMLTGAGDEEIAVSSIHRGALDYISKHKVDREILLTKIETARRVHEAQERARAAEHDLRETVARLRREIHARESMLGVVS